MPGNLVRHVSWDKKPFDVSSYPFRKVFIHIAMSKAPGDPGACFCWTVQIYMVVEMYM